jgi:hypothetical protein
MKIERANTLSGTTNEAKRNTVASIEFAVRASLHKEYADADFVHSILGKIPYRPEENNQLRRSASVTLVSSPIAFALPAWRYPDNCCPVAPPR